MNTNTAAAPAEATFSATSTLALCFCAAMIEGIDLQSMGIGAAGIAAEFRLDHATMGLVLSASPLGLLFGAFAGGRVADLRGRKFALIASIVIFGALQFATVWAEGSQSLMVIRFLCGIGLGGALPNLIAITAEASGGRNHILNVVITAAGMPIGGAIAACLGFWAAHDWRLLFYVGGIAPLVLAPLMVILLPESALYQQTRTQVQQPRARVLAALFSGHRWRQTALLWVAFLGTALMLHLLLNWLPLLMVGKGFSRPQAFSIQIVLNIASAVGSVGFAWLMQQRPSRFLLLGCYVGLGATLLVIASLPSNVVLVAATAAAMGAFLVGAQFILYGVTPSYYDTLTRGTGTGAAVTIGRLGSVLGPFIAGQLLSLGASSAQVLESLLPITAVAAIASAFLMFGRELPAS